MEAANTMKEQLNFDVDAIPEAITDYDDDDLAEQIASFTPEELDALEAAQLLDQHTDPAFVARLDAAATTINRFPDPPTAGPESTAYTYGAQILAYILAADVVVYGLLSDEELSLARHVAGYAVAAHDIDPRAATRISDVQIQIAQLLTRRQAERAAAEPASTPGPAGPPSTPNEGPMARLLDAPIVRPPAGQEVSIDF